MNTFIHFFCLCPLSPTIKQNFNTSKEVYYIREYLECDWIYSAQKDKKWHHSVVKDKKTDKQGKKETTREINGPLSKTLVTLLACITLHTRRSEITISNQLQNPICTACFSSCTVTSTATCALVERKTQHRKTMDYEKTVGINYIPNTESLDHKISICSGLYACAEYKQVAVKRESSLISL